MIRSARLLAASALALTLSADCGHRGPLAPPLPRVPMPPRAVSWRQRGDRLEVFARHQFLALEGRALRPPVRIVLLSATPRDQADAAGWESPGREREFARTAQETTLAEIADEDLGLERTRVDSAPIAEFGAATRIVVALAVRDRSTRSSLSPRVLVEPAVPPLSPPSEFTATSVEDGVALSWRAGEDARVRFIRIRRWRAGEDPPWTAWRTAPVSDSGVRDETARYGEDLVYEAMAAMGDGGVLVESTPVRAPVVMHRDVFPPAAPRDLDAVPETGSVRVFWRPGGSPDEVAALVERQVEGDDEFHEIGRVEVPDSHFVDDQVPAGRRCRYRLIGVDQLGNRTAPTTPTEWLEPRPSP